MFGNKMNAVEKAIKKGNAGTLIDLSGNKDPEVSFAAIAGLASIGGDDASHYLITRLQSPEPEVRIAIAQALGTIANKHTKAFLAAQLKKEEDPKVKEVLQHEMGKIKEY
jgi:HEAT repeat protein